MARTGTATAAEATPSEGIAWARSTRTGRSSSAPIGDGRTVEANTAEGRGPDAVGVDKSEIVAKAEEDDEEEDDDDDAEEEEEMEGRGSRRPGMEMFAGERELRAPRGSGRREDCAVTVDRVAETATGATAAARGEGTGEPSNPPS